MLQLLKTSDSPVQLFARNYERLLGWALHLTGGDRPVAEDLLHDVFILFSLREPGPAKIDNLEGYLYTMLRNLHVSRLRSMARARLRQLSVVEFDSAERGLRTHSSADDHILVQDQLRTVCRYACVRKEKAKAACAFILRFFHGYYPSEVARVLKTTRQAVDVRLLHARKEARLVLEDPRAVDFMEGDAALAFIPTQFARPAGEFLEGLRRTIFRSRRGDCLTVESLKRLYHPSGTGLPAQATLAHLVSCADCLNEVNRLLGIPPLAERHPADSVTREPRGGGGGDGGPDGMPPGGGGGLTPQKLKRLRRSAGEVFEHRPQELCVSVNGHVRGSQRVTSEKSELNLYVDTDEPVGFVEVFSEQEVRMLMLVVEPPPDGDGEQSLGVNFSDGRRLDLSLKFLSPWPSLRVLYHDPTYQTVHELESGSLEPEEFAGRTAQDAAGVGEVTVQVGGGQAEEAADKIEGDVRKRRGGRLGLAARRCGGRIASPLRRIFPEGWRLSPGTLTAALASLLVASLVVWRMAGPPPASATELLRRSASAEAEAGGDARIILHRTINLEERRGAAVVERRRIQIWKSAERRLTVRRLYDESGRLLAGEWLADDGARTVYRAPASRRPAVSGDSAAPNDKVSWSVDSVWQSGPSARDFAALVKRVGEARVEEGGDSYLLTYERGPGPATHEAESAPRPVDSTTPVIVAATLVLNRHHLRATGQTLTVREGESARQFVFTEALYESWPKDAVAPAVFERDAEFGGAGVIHVERSTAQQAPTTEGGDRAPEPSGETDVTAALEIEVLRLLNRVGADLGEQVSVVRAPGGLLRVEAVVETEERKAELLRALQPVAGERSIAVDVATAREASGRRPAAQHPPNPSVVRQAGPAQTRVPADTELRDYLSRGAVRDAGRLEGDILDFTVRASSHSRQALQHAWALKRLAGRFAPRELRALDAEAKLKWRSLMREHAGAVRREAAALRRQLQPVFPPGGEVPAAPGINLDGGEDFVAAAERLLEMCAIVDAATRAAFTVSTVPSAPSEIKSPRFWRALRAAELLAEQVQRAAEKSAPATREQKHTHEPPAESPRAPVAKTEN